MSINKPTNSPLALREGFHVVLLRALVERLQGRDWILKGGTNLRLYFGSIRFSEDIEPIVRRRSHRPNPRRAAGNNHMNAVDTAVFGELTHHQPVFTTADVIKITGGSPVWATQSLSALAREGLIAKVRRGLWALPGHADFSPYAIIPQLLRATKGEQTDVRGYVSLLSALNLHGMIDQAPHVIQIVAERIRPTVRTPFGTYQFHRLDPALIGGYGPYQNTGNFDIATPAKALFDALYLSTRRGRRLRHFPELSWPANFSRRELREWIAKIDDSKLRVAVTERWDVLRHRTQP